MIDWIYFGLPVHPLGPSRLHILADVRILALDVVANDGGAARVHEGLDG